MISMEAYVIATFEETKEGREAVFKDVLMPITLLGNLLCLQDCLITNVLVGIPGYRMDHIHFAIIPEGIRFDPDLLYGYTMLGCTTFLNGQTVAVYYKQPASVHPEEEKAGQPFIEAFAPLAPGYQRKYPDDLVNKEVSYVC